MFTNYGSYQFCLHQSYQKVCEKIRRPPEARRELSAAISPLILLAVRRIPRPGLIGAAAKHNGRIKSQGGQDHQRRPPLPDGRCGHIWRSTVAGQQLQRSSPKFEQERIEDRFGVRKNQRKKSEKYANCSTSRLKVLS